MNNNEFIQLLEAVYTTKGGEVDCEDVGGMNWFDARDKAIAALSAKPEPRVIPKNQQWCGTCKGLGTVAIAALSATPEPAKLPEVEEWIKFVEIPADIAVSRTEWVILTAHVRSHIHQLTAAHAAELAEKDAEIERHVVARAVADIIGR